MTDETRQMIQLHLSMMKQTMKNDGVIFAIAVDEMDYNNTKLCFVDKESLKYRNYEGIAVSLKDLNGGLL